MIKKLKRRIFFIIMISLSIVILGIIILIAGFNYTSTIKTSTLILNRFINNEPIKPNENRGESNNKEYEEFNIEGLYTITIENSKIIKNNGTSNNPIIKQYAMKLLKGNSESGIIGNYIYRIKREKEKTIIVLMENESVILHTKMILLGAILGSVASLIIIYIIAKKISKVIVKPIEETFEKQKQFISDASHELKTPLAIIEANADVLQNEIENNKWINYIQNEIESMNKLINELLLLAKTENVDKFDEYKETDISKKTEIIVSMFESMAYERNTFLISNIQEKIIMNCNEEDIEHIVSILIDNAIKHTEPSGKIIIDLNKEKNNIILQVKNMGEEIPESEKKRIFERFYRIDKSRNRTEKRYGLGLAIAKSIVEKYEGDIEVLYENGFTNFKVIIPE